VWIVASEGRSPRLFLASTRAVWIRVHKEFKGPLQPIYTPSTIAGICKKPAFGTDAIAEVYILDFQIHHLDLRFVDRKGFTSTNL
jgi:hypothetical protein